jgi:hypothetical protein
VDETDEDTNTWALPALVAWGATRIAPLMERQDRARTRRGSAHVEAVYRDRIGTLDPVFAVMLRSPERMFDELREAVRHGRAPPPVATWADTGERRQLTVLEFVRCEFWTTPDANVVLLLDGQPSAQWIDVRFPRSVRGLWPSFDEVEPSEAPPQAAQARAVTDDEIIVARRRLADPTAGAKAVQQALSPSGSNRPPPSVERIYDVLRPLGLLGRPGAKPGPRKSG